MPQNQRNQKMQKNHKTKESLIDVSIIVRYFAIWILGALAAYGVGVIVKMANAASPTGQTGNGVLHFLEVHNTGAAFNLFSNQPEMIIMASFFAIAILTFIILVASSKLTHTTASAMAALSGGITMNMIERLQYGYVIDYIHIDAMPEFPVFNVADILIVVGAVVLLLSVLTRR